MWYTVSENDPRITKHESSNQYLLMLILITHSCVGLDQLTSPLKNRVNNDGLGWKELTLFPVVKPADCQLPSFGSDSERPVDYWTNL